MAQEFFDLAVKYGFDSIPEDTLSNDEKADIGHIEKLTYKSTKYQDKSNIFLYN